MCSFRFAAVSVIATWSLLCGLSAFAAEVKPDVRVMSFNIRYGTANDGVNRWELRRDFLVETVRAFSPDLLGTQETLGFQRDYLAEKLPEYDHLGVGRDDGRERGEMMALYYRKDRFEKLDGGHFWLSETPDIVGSKSWDSSLPRMVTWVKLRDRRQESLSPIVFFNTHFDHMGTTARLESAKLLRRKIASFSDTCSVIVTGDFNTDEASPPVSYTHLRAHET
jgi:endonuclease/exonuclease/phosphatase family metal-dependent hydrolase